MVFCHLKKGVFLSQYQVYPQRNNGPQMFVYRDVYARVKEKMVTWAVQMLLI